MNEKERKKNPRKTSLLQNNERTYSIYIKEGSGKILQTWRGINKQSVDERYKILSQRFSFATVSLHLDVHNDCADCNTTGLDKDNDQYHCAKCQGIGFIISDEIGLKLKSNKN